MRKESWIEFLLESSIKFVLELLKCQRNTDMVKVCSVVTTTKGNTK